MDAQETTVASGGTQPSDNSHAAATTTFPSTHPDVRQPADNSDQILPDADAQDLIESDGERSAATDLPTQTRQPLQQQQQQLSPPAPQPQPLPPPPPPGPRAARLQTLFASSLDHTLAKISWDNFAACYPTAAARAPQALRTVHRAMVDRLGELCTAEFASVMQNRDVVRRLNELEALTTDAQKRRLAAGKAGETAGGAGDAKNAKNAKNVPVAPHSLPAETVMAAHLAPQRKAQRQLLEERLAAVQAANTLKFAQLTAQQAQAGQMVAALERALVDAEGAAALLDGATAGQNDAARGENTLVSELARETRAAELEMAEL
ncbi:hypothetical protein SEPCBS57363_002499 [Sporothrix epigloea]|uniref:Mind kinetochore complex component n=1 Tax=Sporothrix epigloea TaxID=1892477 RepID=A0ABP0DHI2_9PEZI